MKRMETVPRELNLVKKVADFKLMRGNTMRTRKRGTYKKMMIKDNMMMMLVMVRCTVENWPQMRSKEEVSVPLGEGGALRYYY